MVTDARFQWFLLILQIGINAECSTIKTHQPFVFIKATYLDEKNVDFPFYDNEASAQHASIKIQSAAYGYVVRRNNIPTNDNLSPIELTSVKRVDKVFGFCGRLTHSKTAFPFLGSKAAVAGLWGPVTESRHTVVCAYQMNGTLHDLGRHS